jgi:hypothetical protein
MLKYPEYSFSVLLQIVWRRGFKGSRIEDPSRKLE